jgi:SAM-dependent methyltransferase
VSSHRSRCAVCSGDLTFHRRYTFKSDVFRDVYSDRNVYRCVQCGLVQVATSEVDEVGLKEYYKRAYRSVAKIGVADEARHNWYRARASALADLARQYVATAPRRAFELGAGYGYNLAELAATFPGIALYTDELDSNIALDAIADRARIHDGPWDLVILSHVIEHFADPRALVERAVANMSHGGLILIEVPNDRDGIIPLNGPDEPHLLFFTEPTLRDLLSRVPGHEELAIFAAGPPNRPRSLAIAGRERVLTAATQVPLLRRRIEKRHSRLLSGLDFRARRPDGVFLRAVLRRPTEPG